MNSGIALESVTVDFDGYTALSAISFSSTAKSVAVIGANGSGKSTFARLLNGLVKPTSGKVLVSGSAPTTKTASFIFSNPDLQIVMPTVLEDCEFTLKDEKLSKDERRKIALAAIERVGLSDFAESNCHTLSSGQKQLLAMASVLVRKTSLLIADEPTTLLDLPNSKLIAMLLFELESQQLVLVTHDLELAQKCEEVVWFEKGQVKKHGKPVEVLAAYRKFFA